MKRVEIIPIGHGKFRVILFHDDQCQDDWIVESITIQATR